MWTPSSLAVIHVAARLRLAHAADADPMRPESLLRSNSTVASLLHSTAGPDVPERIIMRSDVRAPPRVDPVRQSAMLLRSISSCDWSRAATPVIEPENVFP